MRYRCNDYSVPTSHSFQEVMVKGFVDQVVILCRGEEIARHQRSYGSGTFVFEAIRLGAIGFDAVKQIALARVERGPARLDLAA